MPFHQYLVLPLITMIPDFLKLLAHDVMHWIISPNPVLGGDDGRIIPDLD